MGQRRAINRVSRLSGDQVILGGFIVARLRQNVGGGGCAQVVFLLLRIQALRRVPQTGLDGLDLGAVILQRIELIDDLHPQLHIQLLQPHLGLAVLNLRSLLLRLRLAVAEGHRKVEPDSFIGPGAVEQIADHSGVRDVDPRHA